MLTRKKSVPLAAIALAGVLVVSGCAGADESAPATSIKFVAAEYSSATAPHWDSVAKAFTAETGIDVEVQVISWNDIHQQVSTMIQTGQVPDILNIDSFTEYAAEDLLWPAKDIETDALRANLPDNLKSAGSYGGVEYGIPLIGSSSSLFYNTDLFAQAGVSAVPKTFDELTEAAVKIGQLQDKVGFALSMSPEAPQIDWSMFMFNAGGDYVENGEWAINSETNVKTLEYLNELSARGGTEINPGNTGRQDGTWQLFESGTAGMVIGQSALANRLEGTDVNYEIVPFPTSGGAESSALGVADFVMAFKKDGNQDAVTQFLDFAFAKDNYLSFVEAEGLLPVTTDVQDALTTNPAFGPYIEALKTAKFFPVGERTWPDVLGAMKNSIGLALQGDDPRAILDALQDTAQGK